jgi:hypothetical protein
VGELTTKFDTYPGVEEFTVEIDHYAVVDGRYFYFDLPIKPSFSVDADQRTLPLYIDGESETWIQTKVELPPGYRSVAIAPGSLRFAAPQNAVALQISANGTEREFLVNYRLNTSPAILPPEDYPALVKLESALENKSARFFLLERDGK